MGLPFLLLGAFFAWNEFTLESRLARAGQRAQGIVLVKSWGDGSDSRHPNLRVRYRFTAAAGKTVHGDATVSEPAWEAMREQGFSVEAQVIEVTPTGYMLNRVRQWVVLYRYRDHAGIEHDGRSPTMPKEEAERWHPGDRVPVRFDHLRPGRSAWTGER